MQSQTRRALSLLLCLFTIAGPSLAVGRWPLLAAQPSAPPVCGERLRSVRAGTWRTLEEFWNARGTGFFRAPAGAQVKVRYGGWVGANRQTQTLDGAKVKKLSVGTWSLSYARMQIRVPRDTDVSYVVCPGGLAKSLPDIPF